ncbi:protein AIG1-like isoform X3 [Hibiscus syriacus]|uniref:Protein AIG1-like isoform X3 n=1 Tax=Hibiscus syriacus TaxID=106335 RepID=A0A6A2YJF8_HIBSY|nr:protein AIG1-like isoform X3 [Hibiscus syriacus]
MRAMGVVLSRLVDSNRDMSSHTRVALPHDSPTLWLEVATLVLKASASEKNDEGDGAVLSRLVDLNRDMVALGEERVKWLTNIFNIILETAKIPEELRESTVIPIYKNKGDPQRCGNYKDIKLLSHTMKLWERVIEARLRQVTRVSENQFGFIADRSTTEAIHLLRRLMEKYRGKIEIFTWRSLTLRRRMIAYPAIRYERPWKRDGSKLLISGRFVICNVDLQHTSGLQFATLRHSGGNQTPPGDLLKGRRRWNELERGFVAYGNTRKWFVGNGFFMGGEKDWKKEWGGFRSITDRGKLATGQGVRWSCESEKLVGSDKGKEEDDRIWFTKSRRGKIEKIRGCYTFVAADIRTDKCMGLVYSMYCPVQSVGEIGWDQAWGGRLKSRQAEQDRSLRDDKVDLISHNLKRKFSTFVFVFRSNSFEVMTNKKGSKSGILLSSSFDHSTSTMSEEVADLMKHLRFTEEESEDISPPRVITEDDVMKMDKWIIAKIIGYKRVDSEVVLRVFCSIWGHARLVDSRILKDNMFLFKFKTLSDKQTILKRIPWSFEGTLLAIAHFDPTLSLEEFDFKPLAVWVRIYELPLELMRIETTKKIGNRIGKTIAIDTRSGGGRMCDYLRVRVEIDCTKPLRRCAKMRQLANGQPRKCLLKYERLPSFCHKVSPNKRIEESSSKRREWIIYVECENNGQSMISSANNPLTERVARTPQGRLWILGRDLMLSSNSNQEDDIDPSDPTSNFSGVGFLSSGKRKIGESSKGKRRAKRVNRQVVHISDSTLNSKVGTSVEEDPSELPEERISDVMLTAVAEVQPRQSPNVSRFLSRAFLIFILMWKSFGKSRDSILRDFMVVVRGRTRSIIGRWFLIWHLLPHSLGVWDVILMKLYIRMKREEVGNRGTRAKSFVCERLDRFVAKNDWRLLFPECSVVTISTAMSDHSAISLSLEGHFPSCSTIRDYFKFDACWANEDQWDMLGTWQWARRGQAKRDDRCIRSHILWINSGPVSDESCEQRRKALVELKDIMNKDEKFWFQRSRVTWIKDGDRNSTFFHTRANGRRKKNWIEGVESEKRIGLRGWRVKGEFGVTNWRIYFVLQQATFPLSFDLSKRHLTRRSFKPLLNVSRLVILRCFAGTSPLRMLSLPSHKLTLQNPQGLSELLLKAQKMNEIKGIRASLRGPRISHLLYADDSILFIKNSIGELHRVKSILNQYEKASGVIEAVDPGNDLGLPLVVEKGKRVAFNFIKDKTEKRIQGWTKRLISFGGREVFIKSVVQALPVYAMSCYLLPEGVIEDIKSQARARMFEDKWGDYSPICWKERYLDRTDHPVRVAEFMIPVSARWDEPKVNRVLLREDASQVLNTLIAPVQSDMILWSHHSSGFYSAKSGYNWLKIQSCPTLIVEGIWNVVAKANVLPKIRIFGWRLCHEALPAGSKLKQANLGDGICPLCNQELESVLHAIKDCPISKMVLSMSGLPQENRRNNLVHNGNLQSDRDIILNSSNLIEEFKQASNSFGVSTVDHQPHRNCKWYKPNQDEVKINVDGAFCKDARVATIGVVARDMHGMVIGGMAKKINHSFTVESTEATAFSQGIRFAHENGWNNVIIKGDAISIMYRLSNRSSRKTHDISIVGLLLNEARLSLVDHHSFKVHYDCGLGVTSTCELQKTMLKDGQILNVIDTPGLFDFSAGSEFIGKEIVKCIDLAKDGIHAVLVFSVRTGFSQEEEAALHSLQTLFGSKIVNYMIVVFTGGMSWKKMRKHWRIIGPSNLVEDAIGGAWAQSRVCLSVCDSQSALHLARNPAFHSRTKHIRVQYHFIREKVEEGTDILGLCENRLVLFDNKTMDETKRVEQVQDLLSLVNMVIEKNGGQPYTDELFAELKGYSKRNIQGADERSYEEQLMRIIEMVESNLKETTARLEQQLAEEQAARLKAEEMAQLVQMKSNDEFEAPRESRKRRRSSASKLLAAPSSDLSHCHDTVAKIFDLLKLA